MVRHGGTEAADWRAALLPALARAGAVLLLLAVVAWASGAQVEEVSALGDSALGFIVVAFAVSLALASGCTALLYIAGYTMFDSSRRTTKLIAVAAAALMLTTLAALFLASYDFEFDYFSTKDPLPPVSGRPGGARGGGGGGDEASLLLLVAGGALIVTLLMIATLLALAAHRRRSRASEITESNFISQAFDESLDDLRNTPDVRRAIIACYARMERALERAGSPRHPADAPFEYLARVLERITANGPAARVLTELFERAKFSIEPMGESEKQQAIRALELLRAEVSSPL